MHGGGHERGLRSGTLATHQIVGMGESFRIAREEMAAENIRVGKLRDRLLAGLTDIEATYVNGDLEQRVPHNLNISFAYVEGRVADHGRSRTLAVSSGSACTRPAWSRPTCCARSVVTTSWRTARSASPSALHHRGRVEYTIKLLHDKIGKLRELSPLWEMYKDGVDLDTVQWAPTEL